MTSILRWSGSKAKLIPLLSTLAPKDFNRYVEPFVGSASLFFATRPRAAVLGDRNPDVINVYGAIRRNPSEVADALDSIPRTREAFYKLRAISPDALDSAHRAARLIFLMKACFNGVYRTNLKGHFNVPMGSKIYSLPSRDQLLEASQLLRGAQLLAADFSETIKMAGPKDWVYMDPPYKPTGRHRGEYGLAGRFDAGDLNRFVTLAHMLSRRGCYVAISHQAEPELIDHFKNWRVQSTQALRSVAGSLGARQVVTEIVFTNY